MHRYDVEYTDTFGGEANYGWVRRASVTVPELTHYGYTGSADGTYRKASRAHQREAMRKAKAAIGLTGARGRTVEVGDGWEFRPHGMCTVLFVTYAGEATTQGE